MKHLGIQFSWSLAFTEHVKLIVMKTHIGMNAMRAIAAADYEQRHLILLYLGSVLSVTECALAILTLNHTQGQKLERIQNEAVLIILGCTKDTECRAMCYLVFLTVEVRTRMCRAETYLRVSTGTQHPVHREIRSEKGNKKRKITDGSD